MSSHEAAHGAHDHPADNNAPHSTSTKINTSDAIEQTVRDAATQKQVGNTRSLLLQNMPLARELRSAVSAATGLVETIGDTAYRLLSLGARPQDLANTVDIVRNGGKTVFAEAPQVETKWVVEYAKNLKAPKLFLRDGLAAFHDAYKVPTAYHNTHGTKHSLAPKKSDGWFKKIAKGIPFIAGKAIKAPLWAASTVVGAVADTARWVKGQKLRDVVSGKFHKTSRNKTKYAAKKLFSRAYNPATSSHSDHSSHDHAHGQSNHSHDNHSHHTDSSHGHDHPAEAHPAPAQHDHQHLHLHKETSHPAPHAWAEHAAHGGKDHSHETAHADEHGKPWDHGAGHAHPSPDAHAHDHHPKEAAPTDHWHSKKADDHAHPAKEEKDHPHHNHAHATPSDHKTDKDHDHPKKEDAWHNDEDHEHDTKHPQDHKKEEAHAKDEHPDEKKDHPKNPKKDKDKKKGDHDHPKDEHAH